MKKLCAIFSSLVLAWILFSCHPEPLEGNPFTRDYGDAIGDNDSSGSYGLFIDSRDGQAYKTVKIGGQTWMAENLNFYIGGSKCYYDAEYNCDIYGRLYNWNMATAACPAGWHLPAMYEWDALSYLVGGSSVEGRHLRAAEGWNNSENCQDTYGFSALPGGYFHSDSFKDAGYYGFWWSASENGTNAYYRGMHYDREHAGWYNCDKSYFYSARCIKN